MSAHEQGRSPVVLIVALVTISALIGYNGFVTEALAFDPHAGDDDEIFAQEPIEPEVCPIVQDDGPALPPEQAREAERGAEEYKLGEERRENLEDHEEIEENAPPTATEEDQEEINEDHGEVNRRDGEECREAIAERWDEQGVDWEDIAVWIGVIGAAASVVGIILIIH